MTNLDLSIFQNMTQEQFIAYAHNQVAVPSLILAWVATLLVFLIIGLASTDNKKKMLRIFAWTFICSGILLAAICLLPNSIHNIVVAIRSLF